jgi:hypothetical protein
MQWHRCFSFICMFVDRCLSLCTFSFVIVLSVLRFTNSDYPFGHRVNLATNPVISHE